MGTVNTYRLIVLITALAGDGILLSPGPASAQDGAASKEGAKSAKTIAELRGLVADLEGQVERQRIQLQTSEASLRRAVTLLNGMESGQETQRGDQKQPQPPRSAQRPSRIPREEERNLRDQADAERLPWKWSEDQTTPQASTRRLGDGYGLRISTPRDKPWSLTLTLTHEGRADYSWEGHEHSVFTLAGDVLYRADFQPQRTGCAIIAYDLKAGEERWKKQLWGIPVPNHSQYRNRINLEVDDRRLTIYGNEAYGQYIELLDLSTGDCVGHRVVEGSRSTR